MTKEQLLYKLTGTETPKFITERESEMIDKFMAILGDCEEKKIEYAKFHVEAALEAAYENFEFEDGCDTHGVSIKEESILNAYPLTNLN